MGYFLFSIDALGHHLLITDIKDQAGDLLVIEFESDRDCHRVPEKEPGFRFGFQGKLLAAII